MWWRTINKCVHSNNEEMNMCIWIPMMMEWRYWLFYNSRSFKLIFQSIFTCDSALKGGHYFMITNPMHILKEQMEKNVGTFNRLDYINRVWQEIHNSFAYALELHISCTKPLIGQETRDPTFFLIISDKKFKTHNCDYWKYEECVLPLEV